MEIFFFSQVTNSGRRHCFFFLYVVGFGNCERLVVLARVPCIAGPAELSVRANVFTKES